jgi:hypothetical protein
MNIKNPVIITALFDIGRDKWEDYNQSYNTYMIWMTNLLYFDINMVIYTEEKFKDLIIEKRKQVDPNLEKTLILIDTLEKLYSYKLFYNRTKKLMESEEFKKIIYFQVPEMKKPLYNILIFNKLYFIKNSIDNKHFDSDFYIWCDAGVLRDDIPIIRNEFPNLDKINNGFNDKITFFSHETSFNIGDRPNHLLSQYRYIHGGCFFVPNNKKIDILIEKFNFLVEYYLNYGFIGSEEKYLDFCFLDNIEDYNIVKSDWRQYFDIF